MKKIIINYKEIYMEYLEKLLKKNGWVSIIESIVFAILGVLLICNPEGVIKVISYILGVIFILAGVYKIINYISTKGKYDIYNYDIAYGVIAILIGLGIILFGNSISSIFRIAIGLWIIYTSILRISFSLKLKAVESNTWLYSLLLAILMLVCGLYITLTSGTIAVMIGILMLTSSIINVVEEIIFMKNIDAFSKSSDL